MGGPLINGWAAYLPMRIKDSIQGSTLRSSDLEIEPQEILHKGVGWPALDGARRTHLLD